MSSSLPQQDDDFAVASENPSDAAAQIILISGLSAFNESRAAPIPCAIPPITFASSRATVRAACAAARRAWPWLRLALDTVWVEDAFRKRGRAGACWRRRRQKAAARLPMGDPRHFRIPGAGFLFAARLCRICAHGGFSLGAYAVSAQEGAGVNGGAKGNGELAWVIFWNMDGSFDQKWLSGLRETMCGSRFGAASRHHATRLQP